MRETLIEAGHAERNYWSDVWRYRELFGFLAWRDILVRYKQTTLGIAWALLQPALTLIIFTVVFGRIAGLPSNGVPYPILVLSALLPWQLFARAFSEAGNSLILNTNLISKIYFPRIIVPMVSVVVGFVDFAVSLGLLFVLMIWYRFMPGPEIIALLVMIPFVLLATIGPSVLLAALTVRYRDFRHLVPFIVQLGLYVSPVGFSSDVVPAKLKPFFYLNPMAGIIDGFRWAIAGRNFEFPIYGLAASGIVSLLLLAIGISYFRNSERQFADII
jgi:lipopolysaccharide transport system permease protein